MSAHLDDTDSDVFITRCAGVSRSSSCLLLPVLTSTAAAAIVAVSATTTAAATTSSTTAVVGISGGGVEGAGDAGRVSSAVVIRRLWQDSYARDSRVISYKQSAE